VMGDLAARAPLAVLTNKPLAPTRSISGLNLSICRRSGLGGDGRCRAITRGPATHSHESARRRQRRSWSAIRWWIGAPQGASTAVSRVTARIRGGVDGRTRADDRVIERPPNLLEM
jgi:hypothetical protein